MSKNGENRKVASENPHLSYIRGRNITLVTFMEDNNITPRLDHGPICD